MIDPTPAEVQAICDQVNANMRPHLRAIVGDHTSRQYAQATRLADAIDQAVRMALADAAADDPDAEDDYDAVRRRMRGQ